MATRCHTYMVSILEEQKLGRETEVCLLIAAVETWLCNMATLLQVTRSVCIKVSFEAE